MTTTNRTATNVDAHIGKRLKSIRRQRDITQTQLGKLVDVSFQQIQKYEKGVNRISVSRLWKFCELLYVSPAYFFEGLEPRSGQVANDQMGSTPYRDRSFDAFSAAE